MQVSSVHKVHIYMRVMLTPKTKQTCQQGPRTYESHSWWSVHVKGSIDRWSMRSTSQQFVLHREVNRCRVVSRVLMCIQNTAMCVMLIRLRILECKNLVF